MRARALGLKRNELLRSNRLCPLLVGFAGLINHGYLRHLAAIYAPTLNTCMVRSRLARDPTLEILDVAT